jgi:ATP-dependent Clp protease ATP-binding subunit ClpA
MFERFTRSARDVVAAAEAEARALGSPTVDAEHLLLALAGPQGAALRSVLAGAGLDRQGVLDALETERERSLTAVGVSARDFDLPAAPRTGARPRWGASAKLALERSLRAALDRGDRRIEPGHILLGLLRAEAGTVPRALAAAGIDRDELADAVAHELARAR